MEEIKINAAFEADHPNITQRQSKYFDNLLYIDANGLNK